MERLVLEYRATNSAVFYFQHPLPLYQRYGKKYLQVVSLAFSVFKTYFVLCHPVFLSFLPVLSEWHIVRFSFLEKVGLAERVNVTGLSVFPETLGRVVRGRGKGSANRVPYLESAGRSYLWTIHVVDLVK